MGTTFRFPIKDGKPMIWTELVEIELYAIGAVTVQWAYLEHALLNDSLRMADKAKIPVPENATSLSFKKRLRVWCDLVKRTKRGKNRERLLNLGMRIGGTERSRNRITHGLWDWEMGAADKLKASSFRKPFDFMEPFDSAKLLKIAERIGEFNFELRFPGGKKSALEWLAASWTQDAGHVSRSGALLLQGKDHLNPRRVIATQPESTPAQDAWLKKLVDDNS